VIIKAVADTNVYISAILFGGKPQEIRNLAREGKIELLISEAVLAEIATVLKRKFSWLDWQISETINEIRTINTLVTPAKTLSVIKGRESDNHILECAVEGKAQYIVSGDEHHLLPLEEFEGIKILSPAEFLKLI
jgi:putative PIN family toxin of toxin-antitoxin system